METAQGQLLDALEAAVEEAFEKGCDRWIEDEHLQAELYAPSGAVAVKYGVGVEEHALKTPKKTHAPRIGAEEFSKALEALSNSGSKQKKPPQPDAADDGIGAEDVVLGEGAPGGDETDGPAADGEPMLEEGSDEATEETVEVLWGGRLEAINVRPGAPIERPRVRLRLRARGRLTRGRRAPTHRARAASQVSQLEVGDIIFVAAGWVPPTTCRVLACITEAEESWPVPSWVDTSNEEEGGYWSYASTRGMRTVQAGEGGSDARVLSWEARPKPAAAASARTALSDSPNIALGGLPVVAGAFLGVVIEKDRAASRRRRGARVAAAGPPGAFPAEYRPEVCQRIVSTLEIQGIARFAAGDAAGELALARLHASLLGVRANGSYMQINGAPGGGGTGDPGGGADGARGDRGVRTFVVLCCCPPIDPEEISCLCKLLAEVDVLTILLLAPGVRAAFIDDHSAGGGGKGVKLHVGKRADVGAAVKIAHSTVVRASTKPICVTIDDGLIADLVHGLQGGGRAESGGPGHPLKCATEFRVLYVGGLLCRAYPGVHKGADGGGAEQNNSVSSSEGKAMDAAYFSIALAGATDLCSRSADLTITAAEEDDTYYEYYGTCAPGPTGGPRSIAVRCVADPAPSHRCCVRAAR